MRLPALVLLACLATPLLRAQFQEPTKEELQMTSDPKAPGAPAVYLYREEDDLGKDMKIVYYDRIKVLTEKGKEAATVTIPYRHGEWKVEKIQARTIHPDGTIVPLTATPADLMDVKSKQFQENSITFTLPSVTVGSILEYRLEIHNVYIGEPDWLLQHDYFVHKAHYDFTLPVSDYYGRPLVATVHADGVAEVVQGKGHVTFDIADVPPLPSEDWMPPVNSFRWRVEFYRTAFKSAVFWKEMGKSWSAAIDGLTEPDKTIKQAVQQIVTPSDSEEQKARKIYAAVQSLENTSFTREKSKAERKKEKIKDINNVGDVWKQKRGESNAISLLYIALARAAGLRVYAMEVVDRDRADFDPTYLTLDQFDTLLPIVVIDRKETTLDPGEKMCPFGLLYWTHAMAGAIREGEQGPLLEVTPGNSYQWNTEERAADLTIGADGTVKGSIRYVLDGQDAVIWRQQALRNDEAEVKRRFIESIKDDTPQGLNLDFDHFLALDNPDVKLMAVVNVSGRLGSATGKYFFLPGLFFEAQAKHPFVAQDKRLTPVDLRFARQVVDQVDYRLPEGYSVESAPAATEIPWPGAALMRILSKVDGNTVQVERLLAFGFTVVPAKNYGPLHDFFQKVATADQQQLVLARKKPTVAGK